MIYFIGIAGVRTIDDRPLIDVARTFVHTLVPIAAAYVIAHYFSLLAYNGQSILYLASDPLGKGWDLFGTADKAIDYGVRERHGRLVRAGGRAGHGPRLRPDPGPRPRARPVRRRPAPPRPRNTGCWP